jgi:hypothetical protein
MAHALTVTFKDNTHHRSYHPNDQSALAALGPIVMTREPDITNVDINPYAMDPVSPGDHVEIRVAGSWDGPHTVTAQTGRTPDHLVLINNSNGVLFEHYADPYNTRVVA